METIFGIIVLIIIISIVRAIISAGLRTAGAAAKTVFGDGTFSENMKSAFQEVSALEVRLVKAHLDPDDPSSPLLEEIQGRGLFPLNRSTRIGFVTSVFDKTESDLAPVISYIEAFQEEGSTIYQHRLEVGVVEPGQGFVDWVRLGVILPEVIQPPYGGQREMLAIIRMVDMDNLPDITHGFHNEDPGLLWQGALEFDYHFSEKGYVEAAEYHEEAMGIALKIGMAVAMADGELDDTEGKVLKDWVIRTIEPYPEEKRQSLKELYNTAMKEAYQSLGTGELTLSALTGRLNEIGEKAARYETIELCFDVMAADGVADGEELRTIRRIATALDLDLDEIEKMRDQKIIHLDSHVATHIGVEELLGIESNWSKEQIKRHLRTEFQKWNNRLNTLAEGKERENAQRMLDIIAEARNKYA